MAELEATTVRKGNRKVSLKISGYLNEAVLYWDDGVESDVYVVGNTHRLSRFRLTGSAEITHHLSAGYVMEFFINGAGSSGIDQNDDDRVAGGGDSAFRSTKHYWFLKHKHLGQLSVGRRGSATRKLALIDVTEGTDIVGNNIADMGGSLRITRGNINAVGNDAQMRAVFTSPDIVRAEVVRYDSPVLMGFQLLAAWGEDDRADVALRFAGEFGGIRIAAGIGYFQTTDNSSQSSAVGGLGSQPRDDGEGDTRILGAISIWDAENTGLFTNFFFNDGDDGGLDAARNPENQDDLRWGVKLGWKGDLIEFGETSVFVDYQKAEADNRNLRVGGQTFDGDQEGDMWGLGVVQEIHAADMKLYARYKHQSYDIRDDATGANANANDLQIFFTGAQIKF